MHSSSHAARNFTLIVGCAFLLGYFIQGNARAQPGAEPDQPTADSESDPEAHPPGTEPDEGTPAAAGETTEVSPEEIPVNLRLRRLEQQVQALKERAWRLKARVGILNEAVLGGGVGASASIVHNNKMGRSFRLLKLVYALDGTQIFSRSDESALEKQKTITILTGPIAPGSHTINVYAVYRGHGYGVFKYLNKYRFKVRETHTFTASEGKATSIEVIGFEKGGITTPLEKRPAIDFKVTQTTGMMK